MVRLHLGCGNKILRGYRNLDAFGNPDEYADITDLKYENVDEIMAIHVFEHFWPEDALKILGNWHKALKVGGTLILEMPDLQKILEHFKAPELNLTLTMFALYGGDRERRIENLHKWAWTFNSLKPLFEQVGFKDVVEKTAQYHWPTRDFRIEGTK